MLLPRGAPSGRTIRGQSRREYPSRLMLLTLTTTHRPATDLGYLLYKNPGRVQSFELSFGNAHVFYPEATEERPL